MRCAFIRRKSLFLLALLPLCASPPSVLAQETDPLVDPAIRALLNTQLTDIGAYDGGTQYMMIDVFDISLQGTEALDQGDGELPDLPAGEDWFVSFDADGNPRVFSGPSPDAAMPGLAPRQEVEFKGFLRSLGESTGRAFQLQMESEGPIRFNGEGIVVEPLVIHDQARLALEQEITQLAARNPVTRVLNAYCLEFMKQPPSVNQVFRIAEEQLQVQYAPAANILKAGRKLIDDGVFEDHPLDYIHSIKQWALWVHEGQFGVEEFSERFLAHAEDNFTVAGLPWTDQIAEMVGLSVPGRWDHVDQVLTEAGVPPLGSGGSE
jgi:hypothetical protein